MLLSSLHTDLHISVGAKIFHPCSEAEAFVDVEAAYFIHVMIYGLSLSRLHFVRFNLYLLINKGVEPSWWLSWFPDTKFWRPYLSDGEARYRGTVTFSDN